MNKSRRLTNNDSNGLLKKILYFLIASPGLFLLVNLYPYLAITSFLLILVMGVISLFYKKAITSYHSEVLSILVIIYIYFILSYFLSNQNIYNFFSYQFLRYDGNFFFCYLPFFALAVPYFNYKKVSSLYFKIIFIVFTAFALIGIYGYVTKSYFLVFKEYSVGVYFQALNFSHNSTGSVYALVCTFLLIFFLKEKKKLCKVLYSIALLICLSGLFFAKSRGSYVGFAIGAVFVFWMHYRSIGKFVRAVLVTLVASIPLLFITGTHRRVMQIFDFSEGNIRIRFVLWEKAWNLFTQSPVFGVGFGRYNDVNAMSAKRLVGFPEIASFFMEHNFDFSFGHAHNAYFQFLAETGIVGLGLLFLFWTLCFRKIARGYTATNDEFSKKIFLSSLSSIVVLFSLSLTENYLSATTAMMCISMVVSLSIGMYWQEEILFSLHLK